MRIPEILLSYDSILICIDFDCLSQDIFDLFDQYLSLPRKSLLCLQIFLQILPCKLKTGFFSRVFHACYQKKICPVNAHLMCRLVFNIVSYNCHDRWFWSFSGVWIMTNCISLCSCFLQLIGSLEGIWSGLKLDLFRIECSWLRNSIFVFYPWNLA